MTEPTIQEIATKLDEIMVQLRQAKNPEVRRALLLEARQLMAILDDLVIKSAESYSARPNNQ